MTIDNILKYLEKLIAIKSVSGNENQIATYIGEVLEKHNINFQRSRNSIICKITGSSNKKAMIFNGHLDTVSPGSTREWNNNPYSMKLDKSGKIYGLGSSDMKSGIAIMLGIIEFLKGSKTLESDYWFLFSDMEEIDGSGTKMLLEKYKDEIMEYENVGGFILEPTNASKICYGHRGNMFMEIVLSGKGGHASLDYGNDTAMEKIIRLCDEINLINKISKLKYNNRYLGQPNINITNIHWGGESFNVVDTSAKIILDVRYTPESYDKVTKLLKELAKKLDSKINIIDDCSYGLCSEENAWYSYIKEKLNLPMEPFLGSTDQTFFTALGIPVLIYGPGKQDEMHKANEYVLKSDIEKVYSNLISILT